MDFFNFVLMTGFSPRFPHRENHRTLYINPYKINKSYLVKVSE